MGYNRGNINAPATNHHSTSRSRPKRSKLLSISDSTASRRVFVDLDLEIKECSKCRQRKSFSEFHKRHDSWHGLNHSCRECKRTADATRKRKRPNQDAEYFRSIQIAYGCSKKQYEYLFDAQDGRCAICGRGHKVKFIKGGKAAKRLSLDHCHNSNAVRGLLCQTCNAGIGMLKDSVELLESAIFYLKKYEGTYHAG